LITHLRLLHVVVLEDEIDELVSFETKLAAVVASLQI
jgi:hypothetical protein